MRRVSWVVNHRSLPARSPAWKIDCTTNALQKVDSITAGDAKDAYWHRGTARTVAITTVAGSQTITYASGVITAADIRRPISGGCLSTGLNVGGAYIMTAGATSGTVSTKQPATGCGATTATIEYTNSRVLRDAKLHDRGNEQPDLAEGPVHRGPHEQECERWAVLGRGEGHVRQRDHAHRHTSANRGLHGCGRVGCRRAGRHHARRQHLLGRCAGVEHRPDGRDHEQLDGQRPGVQLRLVARCSVTETAAAIAAGQNFSAAYAKLKSSPSSTSTVDDKSVVSATATALPRCTRVPGRYHRDGRYLAIGQPGANAPKAGEHDGDLSPPSST